MALDIRSILNSTRRTVRMPSNPLDKSTVVNIFPKDIEEFKVTLQPNRFFVKAGTYEKPSVLVVGTASWWREVDINQPLLEIQVSSIVLAESICKDFANGLLGCNMNDCMPGLFFVPGAHTSEEIKAKYKTELDVYYQKQRNWYSNLVKMADVLWARTNGNPLAIDDNMRLAAQELTMKEKPWLKDFVAISMINCAACGQLRNPNYPICQHCHTIVDMEGYKKLGLAKAVIAS